MYCDKCGSPLGEDASICSKCGKELNKDHSANKEMDDIDTARAIDLEEELRISFVHKNVDYYQQKWDKMKQLNKTISWNWVTFFFAPFWFGYRKMYVHVAGIALVYFLMDLVLFLMDDMISLNSGVNFFTIPFATVLGLYGNDLYLKHTNRFIDKANIHLTNHEQKMTWLKRKGGTSWLGVFIAAAILIIYTIISMIVFPTNTDQISYVKDGAFYDYPSQTIGEGFEHYFDEREWEYISNDNPNDVVRFSGLVTLDSEDIPVTMDFLLTDDSFEINTVTIDEELISDEEINKFIDTIFTEE
ncbi:DUF2628 domain-containing protein [Bacillus sp. MCCB 382]|uniref:DUF2628 domain-containing protein n=1 Tax=Bacillus sp. MCCB 382 TaxID=2860197 RepID=UPI001C57DC73|nr:DUF2628 domain-containing protein [Bacillus sp. MCCB 382]